MKGKLFGWAVSFVLGAIIMATAITYTEGELHWPETGPSARQMVAECEMVQRRCYQEPIAKARLNCK